MTSSASETTKTTAQAGQDRPRFNRRLVVKTSAAMGATLALAGRVATSTSAQQATPAASPAAAAATPVGTPVALQPGSMTSERPYLIALDPATLKVTPILTAGETVGDYQMAGTPDGLGAFKDGADVIVFMNHELTPENKENISYARVSRLVLDGTTGAVKSGTYALDGTEGYERLCSASLAGPEVGFSEPTFLTGEEATSGKFGGLSLAIDGKSGKITQLPWLGHISHENQIVVPGFKGKTVVVTTDDDSKGSELYLYVANNEKGILDGSGQLSVFKADKGANSADIKKGADLTGTFAPIDHNDNTGQKTLQAAADKVGAFKFVRLEDVTFDRNTTTTIYFADTGDDQALNLDASGKPFSRNGRIYSMVLDPADPTKVTSFKLLLDGDNGDDIKNPDNLDASDTTLMIMEDRNGYNRAENSDDTGRIIAYDIKTGVLTTIAKIDQSAGDGLVDTGDKAGSWESSGIINVADLFGKGTWLVDVQAHTLQVEQFGKMDQGGQLLMLSQK
ncbi:MAG: alkaline phosphatase PhoX [Thermomicrobiales bacterium]